MGDASPRPGAARPSSSRPVQVRQINGGRIPAPPSSPRNSRPHSARPLSSRVSMRPGASEAITRALRHEQPEAKGVNIGALTMAESDYWTYCGRSAWYTIPGAVVMLSTGKEVTISPKGLRDVACDIAARFNDCAIGCMQTSAPVAYACLQRAIEVAPTDAACHATALCYSGALHLQQASAPSFFDPNTAMSLLRKALGAVASTNFKLRASICNNMSAACAALQAPKEALHWQRAAEQAAADMNAKAGHSRPDSATSPPAMLKRLPTLQAVPAARETATDRMSLREEVMATGNALPDEQAVRAYSRKFNDCIDKILVPGQRGTWSTLFKDFDDDQSGLLTFEELKSGVRERLKIKAKELPDIELKALWVVLDADDSGFIESSEFQKFMQRDAPPPITAEKRAELLKSKRKTERSLQLARAEQELQLDGLKGSVSTKQMKADLEASGAGMPNQEGTVKLAIWWAEKVSAYMPGVHAGIAWLKVFKEVDNDASGLITFDELKFVVRQKFKATKDDFSDVKLKQLWCCVDADESDSIAQVEFGRFVKLAKGLARQTTMTQMKFT